MSEQPPYAPAAPPTELVELSEQSNTDPQPETASATPPSLPAVVDYTERALDIVQPWYPRMPRSALIERHGRLIGDIKDGLSAAASEHQAKIASMRVILDEMCVCEKGLIAGLAFWRAKVDALEVECQEQRHRAQDAESANMALLARLREPDEELIEGVSKSFATVRPLGYREVYRDFARAALAVITEKLT